MARTFLLVLAFIMLGLCSIQAQCTDGTQAECTCATAPVLCSVDQLDNFFFPMSSFQHPQDGPTPLCSGTNSVPNNPTWFAFTAWCTDLTLRASFSNCTAVNGSIGVQIAIYGDCNFSQQIACNVAPADCNTADKILAMSGLILGNTYYFLVDGCLGSYCDVSIDVVGTCGMEMIAPWTLPVTGDTRLCAGETATYTVEDLLGAGTFHWFVDGVEVAQTTDPNNTITWPTAGTFELCIDASNDPCVPISAAPPPLCVNITVDEAVAGTISATPSPLCPGETSNISVSGYTMNSNNTQVILITDASGIITDIIPSDMGSFSSQNCETVSACSYNYVTVGGTVPSIGQNVNSINCATGCCEVVCTNISFEDSEAPVFTSPPADINYACFDEVPAMTDLDWTDNCDGAGTVAGMETGSADFCSGGSLSRVWTYTDQCNNRSSITQTITVDAAPLPMFVNPPADVTVACDQVPTAAPPLDYTNNGPGGCLDAGAIIPTESGTGDLCGGRITYTWDYTDQCNNSIRHRQTVNIEPLVPPSFVNPPADITVSCDQVPTGLPSLNYTNNGVGGCLVEGSIVPTETRTGDVCGGRIRYNWTFTDPCGNTINHNQIITIEPAPLPAFVNPPADITVSCDQVPTGAPNLDYTNNAAGTCLVQGTIVPVESGTGDACGGQINYTWTFTDPCGNTLNHTQTVTIEPAPLPAFVNPPGDITVSCDQAPTGAPTLDYTNGVTGGCAVAGTVVPTESGSADVCGGQVTYTWTFTDQCNNTITHSQTITVDPPPPVTFLNPPGDITVSCDQVPTSAPDLTYTNNGSGACLITGTVSPMQSGGGDICGGRIRYNWTFTDQCGTTIQHTQNITITPAPQTQFLNPPGDITVTCDNIPAGAPDLTYTNNGTGSCLITGTVSPTQSGTADICGGQIIYTWNFTDPCNNVLSHTQTITVDPAPLPQFLNPPADLTVTCDNIPAAPPNLSYTNNGPGACLITGSVAPTQSGTGSICGGQIIYTWTFTDQCANTISHTQTITIDPAPQPQFLNPPPDLNVSCENIPGAPPSLTYTNNANGACLITGSVLPVVSGNGGICGGQIINTWNFTDQCGNTISHVQTISVTPPPLASFLNPPADITVECNNIPSNPPNLSYTNNATGSCLITGSVAPTVAGSVSACGGVLFYSWTFVDGCGRTILHQQNVTVNPAPEAAFLNLPGPTTVACTDVPPLPPDLNYSNNQAGQCAIIGSVPAIQSGFYDACGGSISYTWVFTDDCSRTISHTQQITVEPAADPEFSFLPPDLTVSCNDPFPPPIDLPYSNFSIGDCEISGAVPPVVTNLGTTVTYTWTLVSPCSNIPISHTQTISQTLPPDIIANPSQVAVCRGESFDLANILVTDLNGTNPFFTYHSASPAGPNNQFAGSVVNPFASTVYYILATNASGCTAETPVQVIVEEPPFAGFDGSGTLCFDATSDVNLFDYLTGNPIQIGQWEDPGGTGVSLFNPFNVDLSGLAPGSYTFNYRLTSAGVCPTATSSITLEILPEIDIDVATIECASNPSFYQVLINNSNGFVFVSNVGTITDLGMGQLSVSDIPIDDNLVLTAISPGNAACTASLSISPPNCDCPIIDPPVSDGDLVICEGEAIPTLSVSVGADETANWYDAAAGGNLLLAGSTSFTPAVSGVGVYVFHVETENTSSSCISLIRTPVQLEIVANPTGLDAQLVECDNDNDGFVEFDLTAAEDLISTNPDHAFTFYASLSDAQNGSNPLSTPFTNTQTPTQDLFVVISNQDNCTAIVQLNLSVNLPPDFTLMVEPESCLDAADGSVEINSATGILYSLDSMNWIVSNSFTSLAVGNYTAYVEDANGCVAVQNFSIDPGVELSAVVDLVCNNNGTPSDASDDFYTISFTVNNTLGNTGSFTLSDGSNNLGSFSYGSPHTISVPAQGQSINYTFTDDLAGCTTSQNVGPLNSCSTDCTLSLDLLDWVCNDNGTDADPSDDFYTISINASAINGSANNTYNVLIDGVLNFNFPYGTLSTFDLPADGSNPILTAVDNQDAQCLVSQNIGPLTPCSDACVIQIQNLDFSCDNNGTITDPSDDFYTITLEASILNPGAANSFEVLVDNVSQGQFAYTTTAQFTLPANANNVTILIQDVDDPSCNDQQSIGPLDPCDEDCSINAIVSNIVCDDNGTDTDPSDDTFTFDLIVNGQNTGAGWQAIGGAISGNYGTTQTFGPYPIAGGALNFDLEDLTTPGCIASINVAAPSTCSDACEIRFDLLDFTCNDNGTLTDPSDDFYEVTINASAINPGAANTFEVFADNVSQGVFTYGTGGQITLPANGTIVNIRIADTEVNGCEAQQSIGPLDPCDEDCSISASVSNIVCDDNGTDTDPSDDTFTFDLIVNGQNTGAGWQAIGGAISGNYGTTQTFGPYPIAGGALNFDLEDLTTPGCIASINVAAPSTCSDACEIRFDLLDFTCNDNGTLTDPSDDFYEVTINASAINPGAANTFEVFADNVSQGVFTYGTGGQITLPANGTIVNIRIADTEVNGCEAQQSIGPLDPCDEDCSISASVSNIVCDDNGTDTDPSDDTFTFDLIVNGQNTGAGWQAIGGAINGNYGNTQTFGPYPIAGGALNFDLEDLTTPGCIASINVAAPSTCSDACEIRFDLLDFTCNDNGTLTDPSDDFYEVTINASAINPGAANTFEVFADNVSQGVFTYGTGGQITLPANGTIVNIRIADTEVNGCEAQQSIGPLDPCDEDCSISASVSNIVCDDNGTDTDPSDDTFTFDLIVNGQNTGAGWQAIGGAISGNYGSTQTFGPYPIAGGSLNFDLEDLTTPGCIASINVAAPSTCSDACEIRFDLLDFTCNDNGTLTDPSDDFYEISINASAINPGAANTFEVFADNVSQGVFTYGTGGQITLPANGTIVNIRIADTEVNGCEAQQSIGPLDPCDEDCSISASVSNIVCDDNGTDTDPSDDTFTFDLIVNGQNTGAGWQAIGGAINGNYGNTQTFGPYPIAGGALNFDLEDLTTPGCIASINVAAPSTCSDACEIRFDLLDFTCNDNGTLTDPSDDFYEVTINASAINPGAANTFEVFADNVSQGVFTYGTGGQITLPANGTIVNIRIADTEVNGCEAQQSIGPLDPCDEDCSISASVSNIVCDDNGTGNDASDDTFTFELLVIGQNTGGGWSASNGISGGYGSPQTYGPYLIADGPLSFSIEDDVTATCITTVNVTPPAACSSCNQSIEAGPSQVLTCTNTNIQLNATSSEVGNYSWAGPNAFSDNSLNPIVVDSGWYVLTVTYPDACVAQDSVFIDMDQETPMANAGPDQFLSCDVDTVVLDASLSSLGPDLNYVWTNSIGDTIAENISVAVGTPGNYFLQVTNISNGCSSTQDEITIIDSTAIPTAIIYADPDNVLDCQVGSILLSSDDQENVVFLWNSVVAPQITVSQAGTVTLIAIDTITGCQNTDQIIIDDLSDFPFVNLQPAAPISCFTPEIVLDATGSQMGPNLIYNWYDGMNNLIVEQGSDTLRITEGGMYVFQVVDTLNGCENSDTIIIENLAENPPLAIIDQIGALNCYNPTQVLDATGSTPFGNLSFSWTSTNGNILSGANTPTPEIDAPGAYVLEVFDVISGCTQLDTVNIDQDFNEPTVQIEPTTSITCLQPEITLDASNSTATGNLSFTWNATPTGAIIAGDTTLNPLINQGGTFNLTIINLDNGCTNAASISVDQDTELPLAQAAVEDELDCLTLEVLLNGDGSSEGSIYTYRWEGPGLIDGSNGLRPTVNLPGNYQLTVRNTDNGCEAIDEIEVIENVDVPQGLEVVVIPPICQGDPGSIEILAVDGGQGPYFYSINGGQTFFDLNVFDVLEPGNYAVRVQDAAGCEYEELFNMPDVPAVAISLSPELIVNLGEDGQINATVNLLDSEIDTIIWTPTTNLSCINCLNPRIIRPLEEELYEIRVRDLKGCEDAAQIQLRLTKKRDVYIPNAFTPGDDDGLNDEFMIFANLETISRVNSFQVFDRWGELVFEDANFQPNDPTHSWDGTLRGEPMNPAVFVYWAEIEFIDGEVRLYKGDVTLIR